MILCQDGAHALIETMAAVEGSGEGGGEQEGAGAGAEIDEEGVKEAVRTACAAAGTLAMATSDPQVRPHTTYP